MKAVHDIKLAIERLLTTPGQELGRWARFARFQLHLWRFCARRLWENNVTAMSAALSFRTIFALIPAIVLVVLVLKSVGVLEDSKRTLRRFLDGSGFAQIAVMERHVDDTEGSDTQPDKVMNVADEIERIVERVESKLSFRRIGPVGAALLVWTALTLLTTMERSLNRIFGAHRPRALGRRLLLYWSVLTLGPIALAAASYAGRQAVAAVSQAPGVTWVVAAVGWFAPVVVGILVAAAVYKLLPNTVVRYRAAILGAIVFVPLWLLAKWGFAIYVGKLVGTGNLYGALGLLPLFLVWVNLSWLLFLFGAQLAHTAANLDDLERQERAENTLLGPSDLLAVAMAVAGPFCAGHGPVSIESITTRVRLPAESTQRLLDALGSLNIVCPVESDSEVSYVLGRPAAKIQVLETLGVDDSNHAVGTARDCDAEIARMVTQAWTRARSSLGSFTLADAMTEAPSQDSA